MNTPRQPTYIVTGTTRGIGRALAKEIVTRGWRLYTISRALDGVDGLLRNYHCDLRFPDLVRSVMERLLDEIPLEQCSRLILINNAGVLAPVDRIENLTNQQIGMNMHVNVMAPIELISSFISCTARFHGMRRIINLTSGAARHAYPGWSLYCAGKAAINMITTCVAMEQRSRRRPVTICAVAPGVVDTGMQQVVRHASPDAFPDRDRFVQMQAEGRLLKPDHVADLILDLDRNGQLKSGGIYDLRDVVWQHDLPEIKPRSDRQ